MQVDQFLLGGTNQEAGTLFQGTQRMPSVQNKTPWKSQLGFTSSPLETSACKASNVNPNFKSQQALTSQMLNQLQNPNAVKRFTLRGAISIQDHPPPSPSSDHELWYSAFPCSTT